ncbi:MAG: hypothetical protein HY648_13485 [Acidobacteria bacterium]|nr:hypothetical protein [Acidobacteriota bacterium]
MRRIELAIAVGLLAIPWVWAQDPAKVDPQEYKVELENDYVRVMRVARAPLSKAPMHEHPGPYLVIALNDSRQTVTGPDGKAQVVARKAGEVAFYNPSKHEEENFENTPGKAIIIELKRPPGTLKGFPVPAELDPVKIDPKYHTVLLENERVRVLRTVLDPHIKSPMHAHPAYVVVYLTELHTTMTLADGTVRDNPRKAGDMAWRDAMKHSTENTQDKQAAEIQVELK